MRFAEVVLEVPSPHSSITIGYVSGVFDLLHQGHLKYLLRCRQFCDLLVVGVDSDDRVRKAKGSDRPIHGQEQRANNIRQNGYVPFIKKVSSARYVKVLKPNVLFCPFSQSKKATRMIGWGVSAPIVMLPDTPGVSSTMIIDAARQKNRFPGVTERIL